MPSQSFGFTGTWQTFRVPTGVKALIVAMNGAGSNTVQGGRVTGRLNVNPGEVYYILIGGEGQANTGRTGGTGTFGGGGAGGSGTGGTGGFSGGGGSAIRLGSRTGPLRAAAGGAGGTSGDGALGGQGGAATGAPGAIAVGGVISVGPATGGTQAQAGNGGTSALPGLAGTDAADIQVGTAGRGGTSTRSVGYGGGGGGGGYYPGGGGQAGLVAGATISPGGGGGGGSNFVGALTGFTSLQGEGGVHDGFLNLQWVSPAPANQPPSVPTDIKINGLDAADALITRALGSVTVSGKVDDPTTGDQHVRMEVQYSADRKFVNGVGQEVTPYVGQGTVVSVTLKNLTPATQYYLRIYARDVKGLRSLQYRSTDFWTNRPPLEPLLLTPAENTEVTTLTSVSFTWNHQDPDADSNTSPVPTAFRIRWRRSSSPFHTAGPWVENSLITSAEVYVANPGTFESNTFYEWQVQTRDTQNKWGPWATPRTFFVSGTSTAPLPSDPSSAEAVDVSGPVTFSWRFRDPDQGDHQTRADVQYRPVGSPSWFTLLGSVSSPGSAQAWEFAEETFTPGVLYEWQVRTYDAAGVDPSDWSSSSTFWAISTPGAQVGDDPFPEFSLPQESLGCGVNRVFVYDRGGIVRRGEITPLQTVQWGRRRDDISSCLISTNGFDQDCGEMLKQVHTWSHELVVFRDGVRVWEGPITRIQEQDGFLEIEAKDVMNYLYRRIMRQGYNDSYQLLNGQRISKHSVVERASRIAMNALAPDDPNLLPYLTVLPFSDDAGQSRVVADVSRMAWEEIDDLAATAGLDYTTVGRRIMFWDTHRPIGRLPEMRSQNFSDPPIITEYGMQLATAYAVTNNNGVYGIKTRPNGPYGLVEMLVSAFGESEGGTTEVLTAAARQELEATLEQQAERGIASRWPAPVHVRVPDNSALHPDTNVGINQLIPGVWIPVTAQGKIRSVSQWQKLDLMEVTQDKSGEKVTITMSPAPNAGQDPDADVSEEDS